MKTRICLDAHVLIWGIRNEAVTGQESMCERARQLISWLAQQKNFEVTLPSIVVAEAIARANDEQARAALRAFRRDWIVLPFDEHSAVEARRVFQRFDQRRKEGAPKPPCRDCLMGDVKILGTMLAHGAKVIFTHDETTMVPLAAGLVTTQPIEIPVGEQRDLFEGL